MLAGMQNIEETGARSLRVKKLLEDAERSAESAIRTMRSSLAIAPPGSVGPLLEDVDTLFSLIDAADLRAELARVTSDDEDAVEHARDARSLAIAAHEEARRRAGRWARSTRA